MRSTPTSVLGTAESTFLRPPEIVCEYGKNYRSDLSIDTNATSLFYRSLKLSDSKSANPLQLPSYSCRNCRGNGHGLQTIFLTSISIFLYPIHDEILVKEVPSMEMQCFRCE
jgi:hypothetical protein